MRRWIVSLLILGIGLAILLDLDSQAREVQTSLNEHELRSTAVTLRARLETTLVDRLQPVDAMRAFMEARPNASAVEFYSFARDLYDPLGPMRVAYWVDAESQVRYLYPTFQLDALVANPPLLREDPVLAEAIQQAGERRARVVTDPVQTPPELRAGLGVYVIDPAFVDERLIGFIVGVYYSDRLVRNALIGTPQDDFLVRVRGSQGQLIYGRAEFPGRSDEAPIAVSNGQWHVAVGWREAPAPIDPRTRLLLWSLGGLVIAGALTMFNREITQNMRLASRLAESQALQSTAASLVENLSREEALQLIVEQASQLTGVEGCALLLPAAPDYDLQGTAPCVPSENEVDDCEYLAVAVALGSAAPLMGLAIPVDRSVVGRAFLTGRPQVVNSPGPGDVYQGEEMGVRAILAAPLMIKGRTIGAISLINKRKGNFGESDVRLLTAFANQAAAAIENARLFEAEQHRRQIADRLREATAVVGSDLALNRVLERILDGLGTVVPNTSASVLFLEPGGQWISIIATRGFDLGVIGQRFPTNRPSPSTMVINEGRAVAIRDMPNEWPSFRVFGYQIHSWLGVPLKAKGRVIGMITLDREEVNAFSEEEIALASAFADHAAVAIENARLFEQGNRQVQELQALYETSLQLNLSLDLQALFERSVEVLEGVTGVKKAALFVLDETRHLKIVAAHNLSQGYTDLVNVEQRLSLDGGGGAAAVLRTGELDLVANIFKDERMVQWRPAATEEGYVALAAFPLNTQRKTVGALAFYFAEETHLGVDETRLYQSFANLLALAVTNEQLLSQSRRVAALEERQRLARELHDSVTQSLFSMTLTARTVRRLMTNDPERALRAIDQLQELAQGALAEMRALIFELRPAALQQEGLINALRKHAEALKSRHHLNVEVEHQGERRLPDGHEEALYRVAQEALNNIVKHAQAQNVRIFLDLESPVAMLTVRDDGVGFDPRNRDGKGVGLFSMRERIEPLGGSFKIESAPGEGTTVTASVPVPVGGLQALQPAVPVMS